jgi:hypothetical protein
MREMEEKTSPSRASQAKESPELWLKKKDVLI